MKILVVSQYFWPENFRINDLVAELVKRGNKVTVLTGYPNYPDGRIFPEFKNNSGSYAQYAGARVVRVPLLPRGAGSLRLMINYLSFALSASLFGPWKLRGNAFDAIFVCQLSPVTVGIPAAILRKLKSAPLFFWVLDLWPESLQAVGVVRSPMLLKGVGALVSIIYKHCDLILAQSRSFIPQIKRYCASDCWIEYFPSWSDSQFDFAATLPAPEVPIIPDMFNVMFAGNIGDAQDFPAILQAAEALKHDQRIRWLVVGDGRAAEWVRQEIEARGLADSVLMLGRYPLERMPSFYMHADALLVSLRNEPIFSMTIPGKLQSYLAAGKPVLAMLNGEGADIVRSSGAGLACPAGDGKALADAVLNLAMMTESERQIMGRKALEVNKSEFDRAMLISRLETWFEKLASQAVHV
ncbi:glycosyltransferase family 4 protein [soil metagenome]